MNHTLNYKLIWRAFVSAFTDTKVRMLLLLTFMVVALAATFYHFQEGWGWIDAFYFAVITISTVGYGDFSPQTPIGKLFTIAYLLVGIGLFVITTASFAEHTLKVLRSQLPDEPHPDTDKDKQ